MNPSSSLVMTFTPAPCVEHYTPMNWANNEHRAKKLCPATMRFLCLGCPSPPPASLMRLSPKTLLPPTLRFPKLYPSPPKLDYTPNGGTVLLLRRRPAPSTLHDPMTATPYAATNRHQPTCPRIVRLRTYHASASDHMDAAHALSVRMRCFYYGGP